MAYFFAFNIKVLSIKRLLLFSIIPFGLFSIFDFVTSKGNGFTFYPQVLECIVFIFGIVFIFYEKMETDLTTPIYQSYFFWVAIAFLIFFAGNFFLFLFSKFSEVMENSDVLRFQYQIILGTFTIVKNILLCIAIYLTKFNKGNLKSSDETIKKIDLGFFAPNAKLNDQ